MARALAGSVWGSDQFPANWRATANGLEGIAASRSDTAQFGAEHPSTPMATSSGCRSHICAKALTISFWMTVLGGAALALLSTLFERPQWKQPGEATWFAIIFNAVLIFGFAHATWFSLARSLPPVASTLSVMLIPVLGVFSGAWWLNERLQWQDGAAVVLMLVAMASVLWPSQKP